MVWESGPMKGKPKGLKAVCTERFGEDAVKGLRQDGLIALLEKELDFRCKKYGLQRYPQCIISNP